MFPSAMDPVTQSASSQLPDYRAKIADIDRLTVIIAAKKAEGKRIVHAHGVFDLLHVGHIRHLKEARQMGDVLVVTLTPDQFVNKGPHRPAFPQELRVESLAALQMVDYVGVSRWPTSVEIIGRLKPDIYVKGAEFKELEDITGAVSEEVKAVRGVGGEVRFTEDLTFSSSNLLNRFFGQFSAETESYLEQFRQGHSADEVLEWLEKVALISPLVVGEAIIDEYQFCHGIGKSTKDPVLAVLHEDLKACAGGSLAIANHLAGFCSRVRLVTQLGEIDSREEFVRSSLRPNVDGTFLIKSKSPTIHKRRIIDKYSGNKLLEVYRMDDRSTSGPNDEQLDSILAEDLRDSGLDLSIVADYGHGMLNEETIHRISNDAQWLALNVQCNAGNRGLNHISKYPKADYVCLANHELDIEVRHRELTLKERIKLLASRIQCPRFTITGGSTGTMHFDSSNEFHEAPSLAMRVVDRVGAGDAVFAITSLLVKIGAPWPIVGFIGNAAGGMVVSSLGNRVPLNKVALSRYLISLLK
ncbi:MAG: adenylyltransferase/cytidyltransferase family protein [Verrucomicrobia bacterium]|nr:adenylyltransferase/cytidyltransferase family protein [Verrucomicrobiota bacterium]